MFNKNYTLHLSTHTNRLKKCLRMKATPTTDVKRINSVNFSVCGRILTRHLTSFHFIGLFGCHGFPLRRAALQTAKQPIFQAAPWQRGSKPHLQPAKQVTDCLLEVRRFPVKWAKSGFSVTACPKTCDPHLNSFQHDISLNQATEALIVRPVEAWWASSRTEGQQTGPKRSREKFTQKWHFSTSLLRGSISALKKNLVKIWPMYRLTWRNFLYSSVGRVLNCALHCVLELKEMSVKVLVICNDFFLAVSDLYVSKYMIWYNTLLYNNCF